MDQVARSVDATPDLLPLLPALFEGLDALGSCPGRIASLVGACAPRGGRLLDLACGKGAVAVEVARRLPFRVVGVDACRAFVERARERAHRTGVGRCCRWIEADVRAYARGCRARFDVAMMIGLLPLPQAAPLLRGLTRPGGVYVVDDAVRDDRHPGARRFEGVPDGRECRRLVEELGDRVIRRVMVPRGAVASQNRRILRVLASRVAALAKSHPERAGSLRAFLTRQRSASRLLLGPLRATIWVIARGPDCPRGGGPGRGSR
jgi:ubiquinone/menaquinone biosynthesis C-methylase UbiE